MDKLQTYIAQGFPPEPTFTEKSLGDLTGKVFIVTGGYSGIGYELSRIVHAKNATVYIAGRRRDVALKAIDEIKTATAGSTGRLEFLPLDLEDLGSIKASADAFLSMESRLDVLWNNAGLMGKSAMTAEGYENHLAINCYGHFLFTKFLHPTLVSTAKASPPGSVRVVWASSIVVHLQAPPGGLDLDNLDYKRKTQSDSMKYAISKAGDTFIAAEWARRDTANGVLHLAANPGNLNTPLLRHTAPVLRFMVNALLHPPILGAYTMLFAGLSPDISPSDTGRYVMPWGRLGTLRADIQAEMADGKRSTGFFNICETIASKYTSQ